jgi:hypothetical protein
MPVRGMEANRNPTKEDRVESEEEVTTFIERLDSGEFDGRLFEEIRKLRAEHLAKVCRVLVKRKYEDR